MRVQVWPADTGGCGHYRCTWPAQALADQGADVHLVPPGVSMGIDAIFTERDGIERLVDLTRAPDADVVVMQRPLHAWRADLVAALQRLGVRVVVEIDDCFETIHPRNSSFRSTHPKRSPGYNRAHLTRACRQADLVTVTTPALARRYAGHGRVQVVPNMVPARYLDVQPEPAPLSVGWTGSIETHPTDLQVTRGAVARAVTDAQVPFRVVGTGKGVAEALALPEPVDAEGWLPLHDYPLAMARHGIGIVPLDDIAFNHAKSALKMMEYAALGVPVIATPTPDNLRMHAEGVGLIAPKPKHWAAHLRALLAEPDLRETYSLAGRDAMRRHTIEGNTDRWWDAWTSTLTSKAAA